MNNKELSNTLEEHGVRASYQRIRIYQFLLESVAHPSADDIYEVLSKEIVSLSKTTVYNTVNLLLEKRLIKVVTIENNEVRYDALLHDHGHFKCERCGKVCNFSVKLDVSAAPELADFEILEQDVYVRGTCKACNNIKELSINN